MSGAIIPLEQCQPQSRNLVGGKAAALGKLLGAGLNIPEGICLSTQCYKDFIQLTGLKDLILMELGRKRFEDMRWEELWDASLRIRNLFVRASMPKALDLPIRKSIEDCFHGSPVAVRSSANTEDLPEASFAGLYASYVNLRSPEEILKHLRLVWASLWSDAALLYQKELGLEAEDSAMAVVCQRMIRGDKSGVAFSQNPLNADETVIEAVFGLNQGLVDGDIEPDRWIIVRETDAIREFTQAEHLRLAVPLKEGVDLDKAPSELAEMPVLKEDEVFQVLSALKKVEKVFDLPQDMEWTFKEERLYILQARPITTVSRDSPQDRRSFDLSLRRSHDNLRDLGTKIEDELIPGMMADAEFLSKTDLKSLSIAELAAEIKKRKQYYEKWKRIYWEDFIPFAHGVRLFGQVYNDVIQPSDPYEFVQLLQNRDLESLQRNQELQRLAQKLRPHITAKDFDRQRLEGDVSADIAGFLERYPEFGCQARQCAHQRDVLWNLLREMAHTEDKQIADDTQVRERLLKEYFAAFPDEERSYAKNLLSLARKSYRIRDDDNIYLGRLESLLQDAIMESSRRTGKKEQTKALKTNVEEALRAVQFKPFQSSDWPGQKLEESGLTLEARQLKGQPTSQGIARGKARVIRDTSDLFAIKKGEILVCDAIDPNMTFAVPLLAGIVERRGGMLIHGAIIAREYGIPCVTGIPHATRFIQTGYHLTVDGYYGLVIIHTPSERSLP